ncbi:MAG TPA: hypothetical protein VIJ85_00255 [Rhizomicrobium sp.]
MKWYVIAMAVACLMAAPAFADTLIMKCQGDHCRRERCDDWSENCSLAGYFHKVNGNYTVPAAHLTCNEFGDCRYGLPQFPKAANTAGPQSGAVTPQAAGPTPR